MVTIEERFQAAVNVIKGLPKNGPYQPSTTMMLKFYGLFKQATEGPCQQKKPAFWDVIGKAKWDAWNRNQLLTKQQAMQQYVDGLQEIIETMSFTENVQNFVGSLSGLDNINLDELEMVAPGMREMAESHPNSPFNSRTNSPQHNVSSNSTGSEDEVVQRKPMANGHSTAHLNGDALEGAATPPTTPVREEVIAPAVTNNLITAAVNAPNDNVLVDQSDDEYGDPYDMNQELTEALMHNSELLKQVQDTVLRMNADLVTINQRMVMLERNVQEVRTTVQKQRTTAVDSCSKRRYPRWWPFADISPAWFVLLLLWPFLANRMKRMLKRK